MEIIWSNEARQDLKNFVNNARVDTEITATKYILNLVDYVENLSSNIRLGKAIFKINNIEIRQLVYKSHKILYYIKEDYIYIVTVIHSKRDIEMYKKYLQKNLK